jgi:hypothetical protein
MKYRRATILAQQDVTTAGTKTQDITLAQPISRLYVKFNHLNDGHDATAHPAKCVSKIEVVDGSDVLMSLSGMQAEALHFYNSGECRGHELEYRNDVWGESIYALDFGRFLYDPRLALDPTKFANPQIKITHDKSLGGSSSSEGTLEIFADVFDESPPTPDGFLTAREWYSFPLSDEARLSEDNDARLPIDMNMVDLMRIAAQQHGEYHETMICFFVELGPKTWYVTPSNKVYVNPSPMGSNPVYTAGENMGGYQDFDAPSDITGFRAAVHGFEPHGAVPIEFGRQDDPDDWFDVAALGSLQLRLKAGDSTGTDSTSQQVIQQYRKY